MPYLTDLAAAARKSGLKVVEESGWKSRGHAPMSSVTSIVVHHTAGPAKGNMPSLAVVRDGRPGLKGPLSHLTLARDGTVHVVAAGICWHAGEVRKSIYANPRAIGIEAEATGVTDWPKVQMDAYVRLCAALSEHYDVPVRRIQGHKEVCVPKGRKIDPNFDMAAFRKKVRAKRKGPSKAKRHQPLRRALLDAEKAARKIGRNPLADRLAKRRIALRFTKKK